MRKQIIAITVLTAFAEAAAAGAFDEPRAADDGAVKLTWTVTFGGASTPALASPAQALAWAQTGGRTTGSPTPLPPPPTSEPATSGEITTLPMEPPPPTTPPRKKGYFSRITGVQWLGIGLAVIAVGAVAAGGGGGDDEEPAPSGSGSGG